MRLHLYGFVLFASILLIGCKDQNDGNQGRPTTDPKATQPVTAVMTAERRNALTPDDILKGLREGNDRFVAGNLTRRDYLAQVKGTASGQFPTAVVLSCLDSRIPPEVIFDQGIGDIFVGRIAGNYANADMLGSLEFGTQVVGSKVIVVLGHNDCGAIRGACNGDTLGNLTTTLANILPAVKGVTNVDGERSSQNPAFVQAVADMNVHLTIDNILKKSPTIKQLVDSGKVKVVGGMYDITTGKVAWTGS